MQILQEQKSALPPTPVGSSNRILFGTGIFVAELLHIEKLDKESKSLNFHSYSAVSPRNARKESYGYINLLNHPLGEQLGKYNYLNIFVIFVDKMLVMGSIKYQIIASHLSGE